MFLDKATLHVKSGDGGNGIVAWRREKFVPHGGPAGGDGGRGGHVFIEATEDLNTLLDFRYQSIFKAGPGQNGRSKNMHGRSGEDIIIRVPCGTVVKDRDTGQAIADLTRPGDRVMVAEGGRGGRGNARFTTSIRQSPQFCEPGEPGVERELDLELKLIADVGIVGLPNAGKSTLISVISAAKPKIADYPFTTLTPNLGVVRRPDGHGVVVADIPGLIEGAHAGAGLGHEFLRHVERTRLLLHLVDIAGAADPVADWRLINDELCRYSPELATRPQITVLTKTDATPPEHVAELQAAFAQYLPVPPLAISAVSREGLDTLLEGMFATLDRLPRQEAVVPVVTDLKAQDHDDSAYSIRRKGRVFTVTGGKLERLFRVTDMRNRAATNRLMNIMKAMGVYSELEKAGAREGDTVCIAGVEFDYVPDTEAHAPVAPAGEGAWEEDGQ